MLKILFYSSMKEKEVVTGLKENLKNRDIYNSVILKQIWKWRQNWFPSVWE